jgi:hypothetical protein
MNIRRWFVSVPVVLAASLAMADSGDTTNKYSPNMGPAGSVGATVIQQSEDGVHSLPINSAHPLNVTATIASGGGGPATIADGADVAQGLKADAAATDSTSSWTVVAVLKGLWAKLSTIATNTTGAATAANQTTANTSLSSISSSDSTTATNTGTTNTDLGAPGATACATDTGSCSLNALLQRIAQRLTSAMGGTTVSGTVAATGSPASQTISSSTITTGGTFQTIAVSNSTRLSYEFQNVCSKSGNCTATTNNCYVYVAASGTPTTAKSIIVPPGGAYLRSSGAVPNNAIQATCDGTGDAYYLSVQ